ncbi:GDSL-type esterase/lipase family protein [Sphingomonas sp. AP4-R1]|uniref:SGNH/GDSL hydrolase family protein n=1 Tax=Sphingomonas sp. AP4-R1 TaxID=2735134 RepID=UPI0020A26E35|nr:GDSL-type esterase/lipase family protein [Sphingomonas sp. AP4-R1]
MRLLLDRTAVLFLGVAAGAAIGYAFGTGNESHQAVELAPDAAPAPPPPSTVAPPPPTGPEQAPPATDEPKPEKPTPALPEAPVALTDDQPQPGLEDSVRQGRSVRIGVFGDSFGDGVWSGLYKLLPAGQGYRVEKYSQQSTGFTRYKRLNLEQHDDGRIGDQPMDIAVISFGANDAQGVCGDDGKCGALMSSRWQSIIGARVESYVGMLRRHGASIYWVGLPVMRDRGFDADATAMNAFYRSLMGRLGVPFVDVRPLTVDAQGQYEAYYPDDTGAPKLLRANDGVHMSMNGYLRITRPLAARIREASDSARRQQGGQRSAAQQGDSPPVAVAPAAPPLTLSPDRPQL